MKKLFATFLVITTLFLISCSSPEQSASYEYNNVVNVTSYKKDGKVNSIFYPLNGVVKINNLTEVINFTDKDGKLIELTPSYSVSFN